MLPSSSRVQARQGGLETNGDEQADAATGQRRCSRLILPSPTTTPFLASSPETGGL